MSPNPIFDENNSGEHNSKTRLEVSPKDEYLVVQVFDWKPVKHRLLASVELPLSMFTVSNGDEPREVVVPLAMRWKKNATGKLNLRIGYENMFLWWLNVEMEARDEAESERRKSEAQTNDDIEVSEKEERDSNSTSWYKFW